MSFISTADLHPPVSGFSRILRTKGKQQVAGLIALLLFTVGFTGVCDARSASPRPAGAHDEAGVIPTAHLLESRTATSVDLDDFELIGEQDGSRYYLSTVERTWDEAKAICEQEGGHLATITSVEEDSLLTPFVDARDQRAWIGFTDQDVEGEWEWVTDEEVTYTNWNTVTSDEPNNQGGEDAAHIRRAGMWNDSGRTNEFFFVLEVPSSGQGDLSEGLVAYYPFNGNANDESGNAIDGEVQGATTVEGLNGQINGALRFDGDGDRVDIGGSDSINTGGPYPQRTVSVWFKADDVSASSKKQVIYEEGGEDKGLNIYIYNNKLYVSEWVYYNLNTFISSEIESDEWYHVAAVLNSSGGGDGVLKMYVNGASRVEGEGAVLPSHTDRVGFGAVISETRFHDGNVFGSGSNSFSGVIDEASIYNEALSEAEIQQLFTGGEQGVPAPAGLTATVSSGQIDLDWSATGSAQGYNVYRATESFSDISDATKLNRSLIASANYTDTEVTDGTTYYYRVTAVGPDGMESDLSAEVSASLKNLQLVALEVNQSIQNWMNEVPLIEGKPTFVRAFIENKGVESVGVSVKIKGLRGGEPLPGAPIQAENKSTFEAPPAPDIESENITKPDLESEYPSRRSKINGSLNFRLPDEWLNGEVTIKAIGENIDCSPKEKLGGLPGPSVNEDCEVDVSFEKSDSPQVTFFEVGYKEIGKPVQKPSANIESIIDYTESIYPIESMSSSVDYVRIDRLVDIGPPSPRVVIDRLEDMRIQDVASGAIDENHIYVGLIKEVDTPFWKDGDIVGQSDGIGNNVGFVVTNQGEDNRIQEIGGTVAHEIGHIIGIDHAVAIQEDGEVEGYCGSEPGRDNSNYFPYSEGVGFGQDSLPESWSGFAAIGPDESIISTVWGISTFELKSKKEKVIRGSDASVKGGPNGEVMSYCNIKDAESIDNIGYRWISDVTYMSIRDSINQRFRSTSRSFVASGSSQSARSEHQPRATQDREYRLLKGQVNLENNTASFRPFTMLTASPDVIEGLQPQPGGYALQLLNSSGVVIEEIPFRPRIGIAKTPSRIHRFTIPVSADLDVAEVRVLEFEAASGQTKASGTVLGSTRASPNAPTVNVQFPDGGETLSDDAVPISWTARDPDADTLSYTIQYSRNGGTTWKTLNTGWPDTLYTVDRDQLGGTSSGLVRVKASDGFNTAADVSDGVFATTNTPPTARIAAPRPGAVVDTASTLLLEGRGRDVEDGTLTGSSLRWSTASGDSLGTGTVLDLPVSQLSLGQQTLRLTATDSNGQVASDSVTVTVALASDPSLIASQSTTVTEDGVQDFGTAGTAIDFAGVTGSGRVTVDLYDSPPIGAGSILETNVSDYRIVTDFAGSLETGPATTLRFNTSVLGGIDNPENVQVYYRPGPGNGPLSVLETSVDDNGTPSDPTDDRLIASNSRDGEYVFASNTEPLPVELSEFRATLDADETVQLAWTTASETNNAGFKVQRQEGKTGSWTTVGQVEGNGTTSERTSYRFADTDLPFAADQLTYRLKQVDTDGSTSYSEEVTVERTVTDVQLLGTFPNPARQQVTMRYTIPGDQKVTIRLYDVLGRRVRTVVDSRREGRQEAALDVSRLASGVYFLRLSAESGEVRTQKLTVVK